MKLFDLNKLKPSWVFNQNGNLWKFIFGGNDFIAGETRDLEKKLLYLFSLSIKDGRRHMSNFTFEEGNYWISIEGATSKILYLNRFEKPEIPYHKNIIALDILTGKKLWENEDYQYFFSTEEKLFGIKQKFDKTEISEINIFDGKTISVFSENEYPELLNLKRKSDEDLYNEQYDYPRSLTKFPPDKNILNLINHEINGSEGDTEYLIKNDYLIFNYYKKTGTDNKDIIRNYYQNIFCIFDISKGKKIYSDILNKQSGYNVPDNFFCRNNFIYYLREKKDIVALKL